MKKSLLAIAFLFFACAFFTESPAVCQTAPSGTIFYTGQLDGFLGSWSQCQSATGCALKFDNNPDWLLDKNGRINSGSILVGMGDNLAPDSASFTPGSFPDRINPQPLNLNVVKFLSANYDAVVPGKQDFIFGVNFLQAMGLSATMNGKPVKMVANNLVVQFVPPSTCAASPSLTPTAPLLPDQVSIAAVSAGAGSTGSGGGKGGKGGKGGGGSSAGAASSTGGGGSGGPAPGCSPGVTDPEQHPLSKEESKTHPKPNILWPSKDDVYPWTSEFTIDKLEDPTSKATNLLIDWTCSQQPGAQAPKRVQYCIQLCPPEKKGAIEPPKLEESQCTNLILQSNPAVVDSDVNPYKAVQRFSPDFTFDAADSSIHSAFAVTDESGAIGVTQDPNVPGFQLLPGEQGRICYILEKPLKNNDNHVCSDNFTVQTPLFSNAWQSPKDKDYVIFGALAPDTLNGVSDTDKSWLANPATHVTPQVQVNDPTSAILQALHTYNLLQDALNHKRKWGVVLAQMTPSEARSLAGDFASSEAFISSEKTKILVVLSAADAYEASLDTTLTMTLQKAASTPGSVSNPESVPVFTPAPLFDRSPCLAADKAYSEIDNPCIASVEFSTDSVRNHPAKDEAKSLPAPVDTWNTPFCGDNDIPTSRTIPPNPTSLNDWECRVLSEMRQDTSSLPTKVHNATDIAILEEKDFDFMRGQLPNPPRISDSLAAERILWKAGRLTRVSLLGSTIQALLNQNDTLEKKTFQTQRDTIRSQQLKIVGIYKDPSGAYYIDGMRLMATQIYSVATSDQLANSTSDYQQLTSKDLDAPNLYPVLRLYQAPHSLTLEIAEIGAEALQPTAKSQTLDREQLETTYRPFPPTRRAPAISSPPAFTYANRARSKAQGSPIENANQDRPYFRATMQQLAFTYALNKPNQLSADIGSNLAGVTNPNVSSPYGRSWSLLEGARVEWYEPRLHNGFPWFEGVGVDTQINLAESIQGSLTPQKALLTTTQQPISANSTSITGNTLGFSPFLEFELPTHPDWKPFVTRFLYSRNWWAQPQDLSGCAATSPTCLVPSISTGLGSYEFYLSQTQSSFYGGSAGTRYERNDFQYIELGYLDQEATNTLSAVTFVPGPNFPNSAPPTCLSVSSQAAYTCPLTGNETPTAFVSGIYPANGSSLMPTYATFHQQGAYVDLFYNYFVKHWKGILVQESLYGNYFAYGNRNESILTHYAFNNSSSVLLQLPANFSIGPTYGEFVYQSNAAKGTPRSLTRMTAGFQFNYSFDWHTGESMRAFVGNTP